MNLLVKTILIFEIMAVTASAELWVCQDGSMLRRLQGDGKSLNICGENNSNVLPSCIEATRQEYDDAKIFGKKLDKSIIVGSRIVDMTQSEKDAIVQIEADEQAQAKASRLIALDNLITDINITGTELQKVEMTIDNIGSLNDAKMFLKRLIRYIASQ